LARVPSENVEIIKQAFEAFGPDGVVVEFTLYARGKSTGLEFGQPAVQVWTLRDGKGIGLELYPTLEEAIAAAGADSA
jgi:hypothetical protein